jgi:hypothetical protein
MNHKDYRYVPNNTGEQPTFRVADVDNPILQPWTRDALKKVNERVLSGKDAPQVRCWPLGVPAFLLYPAQPIYFVQTTKKITMTWQGDHMVRTVHLTDKHSDNIKPSWFGESIGRYENGDTLVIDTIGLSSSTFVDNFHTPHREAARGRAPQAVGPRKGDRGNRYRDRPGAFAIALDRDPALPAH